MKIFTQSIEEAIAHAERFSTQAQKSNKVDTEYGKSGEEMAQDGLQIALEHANAHLISVALERLEDLCRTQETVTANAFEDLRLGNVLGAVFRAGVKNGWIRFSGQFIHSKTPRAHSRMIRVWESLLFAQ